VTNYVLLVVAIANSDHDFANIVEWPLWRKRLIINTINLVILLLFKGLSKLREFYHLGLRFFRKGSNRVHVYFYTSFITMYLCDAYTSVEIDAFLMAQATRIFYALTCFLGFCNFLMLARMFTLFNFIIKMIVKTASRITPFLVLFLTFSMVFG
jgi:hypothetical protein